MAGTPVIYNIIKSLEGNLCGLDNNNAPSKLIGGGSSSLGDYAPYLTGRNLRGLRLFDINKFGLMGSDYKISSPVFHNDIFDDFLGAAISNFWNNVKGSDGATAVAINVQTNGAVRLTTGANATHTMAANGAQLVGALNLLISDGGTRFETRLGALSAATGQSICFGLIDSSSLSAPFTITGATVTANATNAAAFVQDAAGTNTNLTACAVNAGGSPQSVNLTQAVPLSGFSIYRIDIDAAGNANFFIDGALVATIALAVATTARLAPSVGAFSEVTSGSQTLDIDYILASNNRV